MKKRNLVLLLLLIIILIFASCFILDKIKTSQENEISSLKSRIVSLEFSLVKDDNSMKLDYAFLDLSGNKIKTGSERIRGNELFIDCIVKKYNSEIKIAFPVIFYSNKIASSDGLRVVELYNNNGFPEIFRGVNSKERKRLKKIYSEVLQELSDKNAFRSSPHILARDEVQNYHLIARVRGGLEILKVESPKD